MPETQEASIGWGGEVWLHDGEALYELVQVVGFDLPPMPEYDQVETTHLKSPGRYKEYDDGLADFGTVEVALNFRPGSDTDTLLQDAYAARDTRQAIFAVPLNGVPVRMWTVDVKVSGYNPGRVEPGSKMEASATFQLKGVPVIAAYADPGA